MSRNSAKFRGIRRIQQCGIPHNSAEFWAIPYSTRYIRNWKKYTEFRIGGIQKHPSHSHVSVSLVSRCRFSNSESPAKNICQAWKILLLGRGGSISPEDLRICMKYFYAAFLDVHIFRSYSFLCYRFFLYLLYIYTYNLIYIIIFHVIILL